MIWSQIGFFALVLAASLTLTGVILNPVHHQRLYARSISVCIAFSYGLLSLCFLRDEFSIVYIMKHSSTLLPWYYKLCAVWGGHEGSVLLWVTILAFWLFILSFAEGFEERFYRDVLQVLMVLILGLLIFILITSNPFELQFIELQTKGRDLNPLLQDPGFLLHPPLLYFGYVGYGIPFAFAMAALKAGTFSDKHLRLLKPWVVMAWGFLTLGITLGSWWAYRELGWGGFWFWDPVENASLMPWLVGTALLHAMLWSEKQPTFLAWTLLLAITAFALSLVGTFLVRSGVLTSVHAFAVDPKRGLYILGFLTVMMLWAYGLYLVRAHRLFNFKPMYWCSRETTLLINNLLLFLMMLIVLLGTLYPLIIDGLGLGKISVGAPYFNTVMYPIVAVFLLIMGFAIHMKWLEDEAKTVFLKTLWPILTAFLCALWLPNPWQFKAFLMLGLAYWVILSLLQSLWNKRHHLLSSRYWAMFLAHLGFAFAVIGVVATSYYGLERDVKMQQGEVQKLGDYEIRYLYEKNLRGANYQSSMVAFKISSINDSKIIYPEKRLYDIGQLVMTDADVWSKLHRDIYISLGEPIAKNTWAVRLYLKPFIRFIWLGGILMTIGAGLGFNYYRLSRVRKNV